MLFTAPATAAVYFGLTYFSSTRLAISNNYSYLAVDNPFDLSKLFADRKRHDVNISVLCTENSESLVYDLFFCPFLTTQEEPNSVSLHTAAKQSLLYQLPVSLPEASSFSFEGFFDKETSSAHLTDLNTTEEQIYFTLMRGETTEERFNVPPEYWVQVTLSDEPTIMSVWTASPMYIELTNFPSYSTVGCLPLYSFILDCRNSYHGEETATIPNEISTLSGYLLFKALPVSSTSMLGLRMTVDMGLSRLMLILVTAFASAILLIFGSTLSYCVLRKITRYGNVHSTSSSKLQESPKHSPSRAEANTYDTSSVRSASSPADCSVRSTIKLQKASPEACPLLAQNDGSTALKDQSADCGSVLQDAESKGSIAYPSIPSDDGMRPPINTQPKAGGATTCKVPISYAKDTAVLSSTSEN